MDFILILRSLRGSARCCPFNLVFQILVASKRRLSSENRVDPRPSLEIPCCRRSTGNRIENSAVQTVWTPITMRGKR